MSSILQAMRRLSGRAKEEEEPPSPHSAGVSPREAKHSVWRNTFDPNANPNLKHVGRSYYDVPEPGQPAKSTWDYHLDAQKAVASDITQAAFQAMGAKSTDDALDADSLRKMFDAERVQKIMEVADKNKDGKISFQEFCSMLRKYPCE